MGASQAYRLYGRYRPNPHRMAVEYCPEHVVQVRVIQYLAAVEGFPLQGQVLYPDKKLEL